MSDANNYDNGIVLCTNGIYTLRKSYIINCKQLHLAHIIIKYNCSLGIIFQEKTFLKLSYSISKLNCNSNRVVSYSGVLLLLPC